MSDLLTLATESLFYVCYYMPLHLALFDNRNLEKRKLRYGLFALIVFIAMTVFNRPNESAYVYQSACIMIVVVMAECIIFKGKLWTSLGYFGTACMTIIAYGGVLALLLAVLGLETDRLITPYLLFVLLPIYYAVLLMQQQSLKRFGQFLLAEKPHQVKWALLYGSISASLFPIMQFAFIDYKAVPKVYAHIDFAVTLLIVALNVVINFWSFRRNP